MKSRNNYFFFFVEAGFHNEEVLNLSIQYIQ